MKLIALAFLPALFFAFSPAGHAQDTDESTPVKVTITRYGDNSYTAMKTDPDAHTAESSSYNAAGKLLQTTYFDLDELGKAMGGVVYAPKGSDPKGILLYKTRYKYDEMNRVGEVDNYSPTDQLLSRQVYHYDTAGKVTKIDTYDAAGNIINPNASSEAIPDKKQ